jgi:hypothetical protein
VEVVDGVFTYIGSLRKDFVLGNGPSKLQIAVGDGAVGVTGGLQLALHSHWKGLTPEQRAVGVGK